MTKKDFNTGQKKKNKKIKHQIDADLMMLVSNKDEPKWTCKDDKDNKNGNDNE